MFKKLVLTAALLAASSANAALNTGDLAFTTFNADEDGWALTTFVDIAANSTVFFTDNEFVSGAFNTGEGQVTWNTGVSSISAGSIIRFSAIDKATRTVNFGSITQSGDNGINATTENIFAYLGSDVNTPTTFLAAIANGVYGSGTGSALISSLAGTGLTAGVNAIELPASSDFGQYVGARSNEATFATYKPLVANVSANWTTLGTTDASAILPNTTAFTVAAVPEPETYALLVAGLGFVGFSARRKAV